MDSDKRKPKTKKIVRRKAKRDKKRESIEIEQIKERGKRGKSLVVITEESRSQPQSRRGSTQATQLLINPQEITRRCSDVSLVSRRDSVLRRDSGPLEDTEQLEKKKIKAVLQVMGFQQKKAQKEFRWDTVHKPEPENKPSNLNHYRVTEQKTAVVPMSKDMAMKTLGLTGLQGPSKGKTKGVNDYSEEEINKAFQKECRNLTTTGKSAELQNCHEAYQVLLRVIRAKNNFLRKAKEKREKQAQDLVRVEQASKVWRRRTSLLNDGISMG